MKHLKEKAVVAINTQWQGIMAQHKRRFNLPWTFISNLRYFHFSNFTMNFHVLLILCCYLKMWIVVNLFQTSSLSKLIFLSIFIRVNDRISISQYFSPLNCRCWDLSLLSFVSFCRLQLQNRLVCLSSTILFLSSRCQRVDNSPLSLSLTSSPCLLMYYQILLSLFILILHHKSYRSPYLSWQSIEFQNVFWGDLKEKLMSSHLSPSISFFEDISFEDDQLLLTFNSLVDQSMASRKSLSTDATIVSWSYSLNAFCFLFFLQSF